MCNYCLEGQLSNKTLQDIINLYGQNLPPINSCSGIFQKLLDEIADRFKVGSINCSDLSHLQKQFSNIPLTYKTRLWHSEIEKLALICTTQASLAGKITPHPAQTGGRRSFL